MAVQEIRERSFDLGGAPRRTAAAVRRSAEAAERPTRRTQPGFGSIRFRVTPTLVPSSTRGRILGGAALLSVFALAVFIVETGRRALLRDERFVIPSSASIQIEGNSHISRAQLLSVFGQDVEQNVLTVPLADRRAALERLPWVERATVMRLLPNKLRVSVAERTPVAFVRQGRSVGLVDANGVLLNLVENGANSSERYSFPVVTGINAEDPLSVRAARMRIFARFTADLDSSGERITRKLSEVDLSNPEDVKVLLPDQNADLLVHFGDTDFLARYRRFEEQLPVWRQQYPKLASADMRYDRQVVLEMQPGVAVPVAGESTASEAAHTKDAASAKAPVSRKLPAPARAVVSSTKKPAAASAKTTTDLRQPHYPNGSPDSGK